MPRLQMMQKMFWKTLFIIFSNLLRNMNVLNLDRLFLFIFHGQQCNTCWTVGSYQTGFTCFLHDSAFSVNKSLLKIKKTTVHGFVYDTLMYQGSFKKAVFTQNMLTATAVKSARIKYEEYLEK